MHVQCVYRPSYLGVLIRPQVTRSGPMFCLTKVSTWVGFSWDYNLITQSYWNLAINLIFTVPCKPTDSLSSLHGVLLPPCWWTCCVLNWKNLTDNFLFPLSLDYLNSDPCSCSDWWGPTFSSLMDVFPDTCFLSVCSCVTSSRPVLLTLHEWSETLIISQRTDFIADVLLL